MPSPQKLLRDGSICSVLLKNLHPKDVMALAFPNAIATDHLHDMTTVKAGEGCRSVGVVIKNAVYFMAPSTPNKTVWEPIGSVKVTQRVKTEDSL